YEVVITAGTKTGHWAVTTTVDGKKNPQPLELEFDTLTAPSISGLTVTGQMALGEKLSAKYDFESNGGNEDDHSFFAWGGENTTADKVKALAKAANLKEGKLSRLEVTQEGLMQFGNVTDKGSVPGYIIPPGAVNTVLELSVLPANMVNIGSSTPHTIILRKGKSGNQTTGGNNQGGVPDPNAKPSIDKIVLAGELELKKSLTATYDFNGNGGDAIDNSLFAWHNKGEAPNSSDFKPVEDTTSRILKKELGEQDSGKTIAITIKPINGQQKEGEAKTVDIDMTDKEGNATKPMGGAPGTILDPAAKPSIENLKFTGELYINEPLTVSYDFMANKGYVVDNSEYVLRRFDSKDKGDESKHDTIKKGNVSDNSDKIIHQLSAADANKVVEIVMTPKNGKGITGDKKSVDTSDDEKNDTVGGHADGSIVDPKDGPKITNLTLAMKEVASTLSSGSILTATYDFASEVKNEEDASVFKWGKQDDKKRAQEIVAEEGQQTTVTGSGKGTVEDLELKDEHAGHVIELAVEPRGKNTAGHGHGTVGKVQNVDTSQFPDLKGNPGGRVRGVADDFEIDLKLEKDVEKIDEDFKTQKGKTMTFTIETKKKDGQLIGGVPIEIKLDQATGRAKTDKVSSTVKLKIDNKDFDKDTAYTGYSDQDGKLVIEATDDKTIIGLRTPLVITVNDQATALPPKTQHVIFTVVTSPDTVKANYWGHMNNEIAIPDVNGVKVKRPLLETESKGSDKPIELNGELWQGSISWATANAQCKLPTANDFKKINQHYKGEELTKVTGWPTAGHRHWLSNVYGKTYCLDDDELGKEYNEYVGAIMCLN
ncbi:hypothetical protein FE392_16765, partial [Xenorhabdus sp. 12]